MCDMDNAPTLRVAANVRAELARAGRTNSDLAKHFEMSRATISHRLHGRTPWSVNELARIALLLEIPLDVLTEGIEKTPLPETAAAS